MRIFEGFLMTFSSVMSCLITRIIQLHTQVPSGLDSRTVGYEDPATHQLVWFNLAKGPLHYIPDIGLYFKMKSF